jgi:hypothetical protein
MASATNFGIIEPLIWGASFTVPEYTAMRYIRCDVDGDGNHPGRNQIERRAPSRSAV